MPRYQYHLTASDFGVMRRALTTTVRRSARTSLTQQRVFLSTSTEVMRVANAKKVFCTVIAKKSFYG